MNCNQVRELLPDLAAGMDKGTHDVQAHISSCSTCAAKLQGFRQTMALLDQWQAPEPGPYFDTRLSVTSAQSCASCHNPGFGWGDGLPGIALPPAAGRSFTESHPA